MKVRLGLASSACTNKTISTCSKILECRIRMSYYLFADHNCSKTLQFLSVLFFFVYCMTESCSDLSLCLFYINNLLIMSE